MAFTTQEIMDNYYEEIEDKCKLCGGHDLPDEDGDVYDPPEGKVGIDIFIREGRGFNG